MSKSHKLKFVAAATLLAISLSSYAENIIRMHAPIADANSDGWHLTEPFLGNWVDGSTSECNGWSPDPLSQPFAATFEQYQSCLIEQTRIFQAREINRNGELRSKGAPSVQKQEIPRDDSRTLSWAAVKDNVKQEGQQSTLCDDWSPDPSTVAFDMPFDQTRICTITIPFIKQAREAIASLSLIRNVGSPTQYTEAESHLESRSALGLMDVWRPAPSLTGDWTIGADTGCDGWTPDPLTQPNGSRFIQLQICHFDQTRWVQAQEVSQSGAVRNAGEKTTETQKSSRTDSRNLAWVALTDDIKTTGIPTDTCTVWTPATNTIESGVSFVQNRSCTSSMPYVKQSRESIAILNLTRNVGLPVSYTQDTPRSETQSVIGTKATTRAMSIVNPVAGVSGIYSINDGSGGAYKAYVDMKTNGGNWILLSRWSTVQPTSRLFAQILWQGQATSGWTNDPTNYPVIPNGVINNSSQLMFIPGHPDWIAKYGGWMTINTFSGPTSASIDAAGFNANTPNGVVKMYGYQAGWSIVSNGGSPFGLWTQFGNSGPCGGAGIVASTKMCMISNIDPSVNNHFDYTYLKQMYLKATN
jgi:hypothetical protein